jgi:DNA ligase (NAD+)
MIERLRSAGLIFTKNIEAKDTKLNGLIFVVTGTLHKVSREQASKMIRDRGGKVASTISNTTSYLILGKNPGSKLKKAKKFNIPILHETDFMELLES